MRGPLALAGQQHARKAASLDKRQTHWQDRQLHLLLLKHEPGAQVQRVALRDRGTLPQVLRRRSTCGVQWLQTGLSVRPMG